MYGTGNGPDEGDAVSSLRVATDPFMGTANMAWMEIF
jgi:hypothetical protein